MVIRFDEDNSAQLTFSYFSSTSIKMLSKDFTESFLWIILEDEAYLIVPVKLAFHHNVFLS